MVASFKDRSPVAIVWLVLLSLLVHSHFIFSHSLVLAPVKDGLFSVLLNRWIALLHPAIILLIYHSVVILQALRLNYLFADNRMYSKPTYLVAMVYILLTGIFTEWSVLTPALLDSLLVIWLYTKTVSLYNTSAPKTLLFNTGLIIGVSILCYNPSALLILVALFALMVVRPFVITELLVLFMGIVTPFYFIASWLYLTDRLHTIKNYIPAWQLNLPDTQITPCFFITVGLILILLIIGLFSYQSESRRLLIHVRKNWGVLWVMLLVMLPIPFINKDAGLDSLFLWVIPASPFIAKGFLTPRRNILPNVMFWALLLLGFLKNWGLVK